MSDFIKSTPSSSNLRSASQKAIVHATDMKALQEDIRKTLQLLSLKDQQLFAVDCAGQSLCAFRSPRWGSRLGELLEVRRKWAKGEVLKQEWKEAQAQVLLIAQEVLPPALEEPFPSWSKEKQQQRTLHVAVSLAAQSIAAEPYEAGQYAAYALCLFEMSLGRYASVLCWQWDHLQRYLRGENSERKDYRAHQQMIANLEHFLAEENIWQDSHEQQDEESDWPEEETQEKELLQDLEQLEAVMHGLCLTMDKRAQLHFAADCTARSLVVFDYYFPDDERPREALKTLRLLADGRLPESAWTSQQKQMEALCIEIIRPLLPEDFDEEADIPEDWFENLSQEGSAALAVFSFVAGPPLATRTACKALLHFYQNPTVLQTELGWQWERLQSYLRGEFPRLSQG